MVYVEGIAPLAYFQSALAKIAGSMKGFLAEPAAAKEYVVYEDMIPLVPESHILSRV